MPRPARETARDHPFFYGGHGGSGAGKLQGNVRVWVEKSSELASVSNSRVLAASMAQARAVMWHELHVSGVCTCMFPTVRLVKKMPMTSKIS